MYVNCHSHFSLNYGVLSPDNLVVEASRRGVSRLALTDINNTSGVHAFARTCQKMHIEAVVGVEFRNGSQLCYVGLARDLRGFENLNRFLSHHLAAKSDFPARAPGLEAVEWIYPLAAMPKGLPKDNEWLGVSPSECRQWKYRSVNKRLVDAWEQKSMAFQSVVFLDRGGFDLHRLLCCIDQNTLLSKLDRATHAGLDEDFPAPEEMLQRYADAPELIFRAEMLLERCAYPFEFNKPRNRRCFNQSPEEDREMLHRLSREGLLYRYGSDHPEAEKRVENELAVIGQLGFTGYFLITWDIIRFARSKGYFHVGRGSGANSIVAYCLGITDVDPIELDLYFERFINIHRSSPPDFDIDFSWDEREEIQSYIFQKYTEEHTAMLGTYVTYQSSSVRRELGKVFGLPKHEIDQLSEEPAAFANTRIMGWVNRFEQLMKDMPRHLSIHAGGILISEESIFQTGALHYPPKGFGTTQFDMYEAEDIGFAKFDILSQRGLGHIKEAVDIIYENQGITLDVHAVHRFKTDEQVRRQLRSAETLGCFYIESPGMRQLLSKLRCDDYLTLVAASSIIRPGVAKSGMMREYIYRFHHPNSFEYVHPVMETLLKETYGIMVYQEDVIKVAHHFAGLSAADSDVLRRGMSGKFRSKAEFARIRDAYFSSCARRGYPEEVTTEVWRQIESFSGYSFSKAHSASFAVESYQSLFLKTLYPREFMVAVVNNFGGFYRTEIYLHEARRAGAVIEAPCINQSRMLTRIRKERIYLGLIHIKNLEKEVGETILEERQERGPYRNLAQFMRRVPIGLEQLVLLIRIGAFRFTGLSKKELLWEAHAHFQAGRTARNSGIGSLFEDDASDYQQELVLPELSPDNGIENAYDEIEILGFPLGSAFALSDWREEYQRLPQKLSTENQYVLPRHEPIGEELPESETTTLRSAS
jgi:DNA polymerase-3 subunit alpha